MRSLLKGFKLLLLGLSHHKGVHARLLSLVALLGHLFEEPVRMADARNRVENFLHRCGDRHEFLDGGAQAFEVVVPVEDGTDIEITQAGVP